MHTPGLAETLARPTTAPCPDCNGTGQDPSRTRRKQCPHCSGKRTVSWAQAQRVLAEKAETRRVSDALTADRRALRSDIRTVLRAIDPAGLRRLDALGWDRMITITNDRMVTAAGVLRVGEHDAIAREISEHLRGERA